jgi:hypothetical protein
MSGRVDEQTQRERIRRILADLAPNATVKFDPNSAWIRFKVVHEPTGTVLMASSGEWDAGELAERSDDWICKAIGALSGGRIGVRTFETGDGYQARYGDYDILVEARDDGWYWSVTDRNTGNLHDSPQRKLDAEEAKKEAARSVGTLSGEMTLSNRVTLGDVYNKVQWVKFSKGRS